MPKPNFMPILKNRSMSEIPVTMSALSIGMLVTPIITEREVDFIFLNPTQVHIPITVAMAEDKSAMESVVDKASIISRLEKSEMYHLNEKPPHLALVLLELKLNTISVNIGAYKKIKISTI